MKDIRKFIPTGWLTPGLLLVIAALSLLSAQAAPAPLPLPQPGEPTTPTLPTDLREWFASVASLAAVIVVVVAFVRKRFAQIDGLIAVAFALFVGAGLGAAGAALGFLDGGWLASVGFGLSAGFAAAGGIDALRSIVGKGELSEASATRTDAARLRLR